MKFLDISPLIEGLVLIPQLALRSFDELLSIGARLSRFFFSISDTISSLGSGWLNPSAISSLVLIAKLEEALQKGLRIISLFAFIIAVITVMYGGYQIRNGNADAGKMSILGGLVIGLAIIIVTSIFEIAELPVLKVMK